MDKTYQIKPIDQSYRVNQKLYAGEYPGDRNDTKAANKVKQMVGFGIRHFIDLTEEGELNPYHQLLPEGTTYFRFPVRDCSVPHCVEVVDHLIYHIDECVRQGGIVYLHCWGGVGRTGTIIACYLAKQMKNPTLHNVLAELRRLFAAMPKATYRKTPETREQIEFISNFIEYLERTQNKVSECCIPLDKTYIIRCGTTPHKVENLKDNEIFVFGSNLNGFHGGGAAAFAMKHFGAVWGVGVGITGQSYAIPTMQGGVDTIKPYVDQFIAYAKSNPDKYFYVTPIGCGIAGFNVKDIAPLFLEAVELSNISLPESFIDFIEDRYSWDTE